MSISSIYLFAGIVLVALIFWDAFEVMLLPLPIRRNLRLVMLFVRCTWKSWNFVAQRFGPGDRRAIVARGCSVSTGLYPWFFLFACGSAG